MRKGPQLCLHWGHSDTVNQGILYGHNYLVQHDNATEILYRLKVKNLSSVPIPYESLHHLHSDSWR